MRSRTAAAIVLAVAVGLGSAAVAAPAEATTYTKPGSINTKEATKVFQQMMRQRCLHPNEVRKIVKGKGALSSSSYGTELWYDGDHKSRIDWLEIRFSGDCAYWIHYQRKGNPITPFI